MSFTESIAAGRAFMAGGDPPINANRELVATGVANLGGALLGAMPAGGGTSQTAVVRAAGGCSQKASLVTAGAAAATMLLLAPLLGLLPNATLAAVVIVYSVGLIQPAEFAAIRKVRTMEFRWAAIACLGVLVFGTLQGIVVAIIVSLIGLASQVATRASTSSAASAAPTTCCVPCRPSTRRRDLPRPADRAARRAAVLRQCAERGRPHEGPDRDSTSRACWRST
jgi:MFS superfamily sulfate permease-like transporter